MMFEGDGAEDLVTVVVSHDPNQAALLKGLLEDHGLVVATPGLEHRAMLGMAGSFMKIPIKVPAGRLPLRALRDERAALRRAAPLSRRCFRLSPVCRLC